MDRVCELQSAEATAASLPLLLAAWPWNVNVEVSPPPPPNAKSFIPSMLQPVLLHFLLFMPTLPVGALELMTQMTSRCGGALLGSRSSIA